jgi:cholesterol oxidase
MRTSAGMPHAKAPWTFEEVGMADIPVAVDRVCALSGEPAIDVFAHCMGSAMLGMALLGSESEQERFWDLRRQLPNRIRRLVMSQVAPAVVFTPANVFRAYAMQYLRHYIPLRNYEFRPAGKPSAADRMMDRILATLPYPEAEFDRENPMWPPWHRTPWVGTRHRMDALYGRDFNVNNLPQGVLDYIDDHFGPLSIDTVSQAIHFARVQSITDRQGFNDYVRPDRLRERFLFPVFHVHGRQNGLVSKQTPEHFRKVLTDSDGKFGSQRAFLRRLFDAGHQDLLIGRPAAAMFGEVNAYLENPFTPVPAAESEITATFSARIPAFGVRVPTPFASKEICSLGDEDASGVPIAAVLIAVVQDADGRYLPADETGHPVQLTPDRLAGQLEWRAVTPVAPGEKRTRFTFDLAGYASPADACGIMTLLLYNQSAEIGAPLLGDSRSFHSLAIHVARNANGGTRLADLARLVADPNGAMLGGEAELESFIGKLVEQMSASVQRTFETAGTTELGLGILRPPPRRDPSQPRPAELSFALASCQYPGGLLDRTPPGVARDSPQGPSDASWLRLLAVLEGSRTQAEEGRAPLPVPEFLVLAGDQVYADATAGLFDARRLDDRYRVSYESFFGARGPRAVLSRLPAVMRLDDHEIGDNWEPDPAGSYGREWPETESMKEQGIQAFLRNQRDEDSDGAGPHKLWDDAALAGFDFFWADARTERTPRTASTVGSASLLGQEQSDALDKWLADRNVAGPRFVVSAAMVLPRHLEIRGAAVATSIRSDSWDGYPASLSRLLAGVYQRGTDDVVFLSGDEHLSNVASIRISKPGAPRVVVAHSVHSSALYAPYPFANAIEEDFATDEEFEFSHAGTMYHCAVKTWFPSRGDGFAVLSIAADGPAWRVSVRFDRETGHPADPVNVMEFRVGARV